MNNPLLNKLNKDLKFVYSDNDTLSIIFNNNEILMGVVGEFNNNLKELEKITETKIYSRGNSILVKSSSTKNELVKNAIIFLTDQLILNGSIEKKDIISSINKFMINEKTDKKVEIKHEIYIYDGVGHAFANPSGRNYAPEETQDAWVKTLTFLENNL